MDLQGSFGSERCLLPERLLATSRTPTYRAFARVLLLAGANCASSHALLKTMIKIDVRRRSFDGGPTSV